MAMAATKSLASTQKTPQRGSTGKDDPLETSRTRRSNTGLWHGGGWLPPELRGIHTMADTRRLTTGKRA